MNIIARTTLRKWILSPWPDRNLDLHISVVQTINTSMRQGLLSKEDVFHTLRYLCGYEDRSRTERIERSLQVLSTLLEIDDYAYARYILGKEATKEQISTALARMNAIGLWENDCYESSNI